jgi:hypothetical protein
VPECIHGLDFASCDICSPKKPPVVERAEPKPRAVRTPPARNLRAKAPQRLHVVLTLEEFADVLAEGELADPIYYVGPEELAWAERRRSPRALEQVVLVVRTEAVLGRDTMPLSAVQLVAVANSVAQERARELLALTSFTPKVAVHPPWFTPPA